MLFQPENHGLGAELFDSLLHLNKDCPFHNLLEIRIKSPEPGGACVYIDLEEKHNNPQNITHGGVAFSLADTAMGLAAKSLGQLVVTLEANINYTQPVKKGEIVLAMGRVIKMGKKTTICEAELTNQKQELIAISRGTYYNMGKYQAPPRQKRY